MVLIVGIGENDRAWSAQWAQTALLLGGLSALILLIGQALGGTTGLLIAGVEALVINGVSYFYSDRLALRAMRAKQVGPL